MKPATAEQMRRLDTLAHQRGLPALELMENAGRAVARAAARFLEADLGLRVRGAPVAVCCGKGANGGDGLVAARHLAAAGAAVSAFLCPPKAGEAHPAVVQVNRDRAAAAGVSVVSYGPACGLEEALASAALAVDALLGTGTRGAPRGEVREMIEALLRSGRPVLAVDIPSGLDADTGERPGPSVRAAKTLALGLSKPGLLAPAAREAVGELEVLDIGYPPQLVEEALRG